ncbi:MAG TPA: DNA translocase FtsK [Verrucomicrobiae bacterium]|nr:DNA translocase FtsK [Verrucomicrobiae bacterium]
MGKDSKHSGSREIWAVVLVVLSLLLLLSLISYDPYDVGAISASEHRPAANFIGPVGAWIAFGTFQAFGLGAYGLMAVLAVIGATLLLGRELPWRGKIGAGALLLVSLSALLHVAGLVRAQRMLNLPGSAGGFVGLFIGGFFQRLVGKPGTVIIFAGGYVISLILLINFRPSYWVALTVGAATDFWQRKHRRKGGSSVEEELRDREREITIKEFQTDRELARSEKEARKLEASKSNGDEEAAKSRRPEPKFEDYTVSRPNGSAEKKKPAEEGAPSLVEKIADKIKPKKDAAAAEPAAATASAAAAEAEAAGAIPSAPKPPKKHAAPTVLGSVSAASGEEYLLPTADLLEQPPSPGKRDVMDDLKTSARVLRETLQEFGIEVESGDVTKGPTVTLFELYPAAGVRVEKISSLSNNIAMTMRAEKVRILAPVPGKGTVGIEVPNTSRTTVYLRDILESDEWRNSGCAIPVALGRDVKGNPILGDLANMPHLLIAGATGSGKTVCVNAILASLLYRFTAEDLRLVLIDPKMVEMQHYNALPHLIVPVVTEAKKVPLALGWVIREMEKRFQIFAKSGVRNVTSFNSRPKKSVEPEVEAAEEPEDEPREKPEYTTNAKPTPPKAEQELLKIEVPRDFELIIPDKLPYIVVVCDELADLMTTVGKDVEMAISRLTALGRAAGIHLVIATQRPSVNVVTGVIKANIPARIAFQVASMQDSRVILDSQGAEKLLGKGDMLYEPGSGKAIRAQGVLVLDKEITRIVDFIGAHAKPRFEKELEQKLKRNVNLPDGDPSEEDEELVEQCIEVIRQTNRASVSVLQRRLRIGYTRAARIMDLLEERGIVGPNKGAEPREILMDLDEEVAKEK